MSDTSEALQARSGISLGTIFRLLAIGLGIMSAIALARDGFNVTLNEYLDAVVTVYDDTFTAIASVAFDPAIRAAFAKLRELFDWHLTLYPHWKHAFVLLWLSFGSVARGFAREWFRSVRVFHFVWGGICALFGGVMSGTVPLEDDGIVWWSTAAVSLHMAGLINRVAPLLVSNFPIWLRLSLFVSPVALALFATKIIIPTTFQGMGLRSPGLAILAGLVALTGVGMLLGGLWEGGERGRPNPNTSAGLDILSVLGGAAFIMWLGRALA